MRERARHDPDARATSAIETEVRSIVRELLSRPIPEPTIAEVADRLSLEVRTLQRRLGKRGVRFRTLLRACQLERALEELRNRDVLIRDVAARLGYSDPAHFARAFRRWTGCTPTEYRDAPRVVGSTRSG